MSNNNVIKSISVGLMATTIKRTVWISQGKSSRFTLFDDDSYAIDLALYFNQRDQQYYTASENIIRQCGQQLEFIGFQNATLFGGIMNTDHHFWFPVFHSKSANDQNFRYFMEVVERAKTGWLQKKVDDDPRSGHRYRDFNKKPAPNPTMTPDEMLAECFPYPYYIEDPTHPLLQLKQKLSNNDVEEEEDD